MNFFGSMFGDDQENNTASGGVAQSVMTNPNQRFGSNDYDISAINNRYDTNANPYEVQYNSASPYDISGGQSTNTESNTGFSMKDFLGKSALAIADTLAASNKEQYGKKNYTTSGMVRSEPATNSTVQAMLGTNPITQQAERMKARGPFSQKLGSAVFKSFGTK